MMHMLTVNIVFYAINTDIDIKNIELKMEADIFEKNLI